MNHKWTYTRTYCTDKNMLQNTEKNRTFSTQNTKISARSLAISYNIYMFSVKYCKKKKTRKKRPCYQLPRKNWWLPCPRPPTRALIREISTGEITVSITPVDHLEGPYLLKTRRWWRSGKKVSESPPPPPRSSAFLGGPKKTVCCAPPLFQNPGSAPE